MKFINMKFKGNGCSQITFIYRITVYSSHQYYLIKYDMLKLEPNEEKKFMTITKNILKHIILKITLVKSECIILID